MCQITVVCLITHFNVIDLILLSLEPFSSQKNNSCTPCMPMFKLTERTPIDQSAGKVRENKSLATSLNTWQTKPYYFKGKFYLKTLNPKKTWWRHTFNFKYIFLMMNLQLASLWAPY